MKILNLLFIASLTFHGLSVSLFAQSIEGLSDSEVGVRGTSKFAAGVIGLSDENIGVRGSSLNSYGLSGSSDNLIGVYGSSTNGYGSYFTGLSSADLVLGATVSDDNGIISSDPDYPSSDIVLSSNHNVVIDLDKNGSETGVFEVWDTGGDVLLRIQEGGLFEIWNANGLSNRTLQLDVNGNLAIDGTLTEGSDRNRKENILPVNNHEVLHKLLDIPVSTWNYIGESTPHLGPMAQDFYQAFRLGATNKGIAGVDMQGVLLAAMQAQQEIIEEQHAAIEQLSNEILELRKLITQE